MAHHEPPLSPQPGESGQTVPQPTVAATVPAAPAEPGTHDAAQHPGSQPAQGWGAPQQEGQPAQGWGAPQQEGQPAQGWGAPQQEGQPAQGWGAPQQQAVPEQLYPQQPGQYRQPNGVQQPGGWGAPPPVYQGQRSAGARWRGLSTTQKGLAAGAVAVVIAGGAGAAVWAATSANSANSANAANSVNGFTGANGRGGQAGQNGTNGQGFGAQGGTRGQGFGAGGLGVGMMGEVLHGEFVVVRDNATVTMVEQTGTVTAVSGQSVTVKSTDGFEQTYALSSSTQYAARGARGQGGTGGTQQSATLAQGQTVTVSALKDGLAAQSILIQGTSSGSSTN